MWRAASILVLSIVLLPGAALAAVPQAGRDHGFHGNPHPFPLAGAREVGFRLTGAGPADVAVGSRTISPADYKPASSIPRAGYETGAMVVGVVLPLGAKPATKVQTPDSTAP